MHLLKTSAAALLLATGLSAHATVIDYVTLTQISYDSGIHTYTALDDQDTSMTVEQANGASMGPIGGAWPGLHLGGQQDSDNYTFTFSQAVTSVSFNVTAMSTSPNNYSEVFSNFTTSAASSITFQSVFATFWDGVSVTTNNDGGEFWLTLTSVDAAGFSSVSFDHIQTGRPNGSVIEQIDYTLAPVPEPASVALLLAGLGVVAAGAKRGRRA